MRIRMHEGIKASHQILQCHQLLSNESIRTSHVLGKLKSHRERLRFETSIKNAKELPLLFSISESKKNNEFISKKMFFWQSGRGSPYNRVMNRVQFGLDKHFRALDGSGRMRVSERHWRVNMFSCFSQFFVISLFCSGFSGSDGQGVLHMSQICSQVPTKPCIICNRKGSL